MAQNAVSINMLSNVREAVRGVNDVADAVEDAEGRLHDLTKEGDTSTDRMEQDFRDLAKTADRTSDQLRDKFRAAYRDVRRSSDDTADSVVRSQRRMSERSQEVGQEIRQNLGEGIANAARGDFASLADTIGDTLGGAVAGIGGIATAGLAAAGAVGLGAIVAVLGAIQEEARKSEERVRAMYDDFAESGRTFVSEDFIGRSIQEIQNDTGRWNQALDRTHQTGLDMSVVLRAMAGDQEAIATVHGEYVRQRDEELDKIRESGRSLEDQAGYVDAANTKFAEQSGWITQIQKDTGTAADKAAAYRDAMGGASSNIDDIAQKWAGIPKSQQLELTLNTWAFDRAWDEIQRKARNGITVNTAWGGVRPWQ